MAEGCDAAAAKAPRARMRALYVHAALGTDHGDELGKGFVNGGTQPDEHYVYIGCFDASTLERRGLSKRPDAISADAKVAAASGDADDVRRCSLGCARHAYFAVGAARLVGGPCLCGELGTIEWVRDREGIRGLHSKGLRSLS